MAFWSDHYYPSQNAIVDLAQWEHVVVLWYYKRTGLAQVSFSAPSDILSWQATQYRVVTKQVTVVDATLQSVGIALVAKSQSRLSELRRSEDSCQVKHSRVAHFSIISLAVGAVCDSDSSRESAIRRFG